MAYILCIETATTNCSVALAKNGDVLALREDNSSEYSHAERLHVFIEAVLQEAGIPKSKLDAVAISKGPGSYTGLRIGVSAAKGLCYALDIPLIAVSTLESLAAQAEPGAKYIVPMLDARRMEVYSAVFFTKLDPVREVRAEVLDTKSFSHYLDEGTVCFIGNGAAKFRDICTHPNATFNSTAMPSAKEMVSMAYRRFQNSLTEDVAYFEPYYLKDFLVTR